MARSRLPSAACLKLLADRVILPLVDVAVFAGLVGCASSQWENRPLAADQSAATYDARSLTNGELRRFLGENLSDSFTIWPPRAWSFEMLSWVAFYYNPTLDVARAQWETARAGLKNAATRPNPTLTLAPGYNTSARGGVSPWLPALNLDFLLEGSHKRELRTEAARLAAESSRQAVYSAAWQVRAELRRALLGSALARQRSIAWQNQVDAQQRITTLLGQRQVAGSISAGEVAAAHLALTRIEAAAAEAQRQLPVARQHVAQVLGLPDRALEGVDLPELEQTKPLSAEQLVEARRQSLQSRADVLGALARYEASQAELALAAAKQNPDLHFGPGYQWDQGENKWSLALSFELPLFNHREGLLAEAEARRREAAAIFIATQAQALVEIDAAAAALSAAEEQMASLQRILSETEQQQARMELRLKAGGADQLEVQGARLDSAVAGLALAEARAQAALAFGRLEDALQVPFARLAALEKPGVAPPFLPLP